MRIVHGDFNFNFNSRNHLKVLRTSFMKITSPRTTDHLTLLPPPHHIIIALSNSLTLWSRRSYCGNISVLHLDYTVLSFNTIILSVLCKRKSRGGRVTGRPVRDSANQRILVRHEISSYENHS